MADYRRPIFAGDVDWSKMNQPFGSISAGPFPTPSERLGNAMQDAMMAAGANPGVARHLTSGLGGIFGMTPLSVPIFAADAIDANARGDKMGTAMAMAGMIPGGRPAARSASLGMETAERMARAKEMGFYTQMPLYHGTGSSFNKFKAVPTNADGMVTPGVSLSRGPEIANEYAANAPANQQVLKLLHRADRPAAMTLNGDETHAEVVATLREAFDNGHDAVLLRNYTSPGGFVETIKPSVVLMLSRPNSSRTRFVASAMVILDLLRWDRPAL